MIGVGEAASERALILAPHGRDALIAAALLKEAGIPAEVCPDLPALTQEIGRGAGLAVVTEEAFRTADLKDLSAWIADQPPWSDFPFVLLTERGGGLERNPAAARLSGVLGNVTFLERPFHPTTLVSLARTVLRGRRRQYEARTLLENMREGEERLQTALHAGRLGSWEFDVATATLTASGTCKANFGRPADVPFTYDDLCRSVHPEDQERMRRAVEDSLSSGQDYAIEYRNIWPDGSVHWVEIRARVLRDENGRPLRMIGVSTEITDRKTAEAERERLLLELASERARFQAAIENMPVGVGLIETDGTVVLANPAFRAIMPDATLPSSRPNAEQQWIAQHPDGTPLKRSEFPGARALRGESVPGIEFQHLRGGASRWYRVSGIPVRDAVGRVSGALVAMVDIDQERRAAEHQRLLINELNHRVKNTLATVQSISAQTLRNAATTGEARDAVEARLLALSRAHDVLTRENWEGAFLSEVVAQAVEPYRMHGEERLQAAGPDIRLPPRMALALSMALQELATNAVKYGALSNAAGRVHITWTVHNGAVPPRLALRWLERDGPRVNPPRRRGFGSRLIERSLAQDLDGSVKIDFAPQGVECIVDAPIR